MKGFKDGGWTTSTFVVVANLGKGDFDDGMKAQDFEKVDEMGVEFGFEVAVWQRYRPDGVKKSLIEKDWVVDIMLGGKGFELIHVDSESDLIDLLVKLAPIATASTASQRYREVTHSELKKR